MFDGFDTRELRLDEGADPVLRIRVGLAELANEDRDRWLGSSLSERLIELAELRERLNAEYLRLVGEWQRDRAWEADGSRCHSPTRRRYSALSRSRSSASSISRSDSDEPSHRSRSSLASSASPTRMRSTGSAPSSSGSSLVSKPSNICTHHATRVRQNLDPPWAVMRVARSSSELLMVNPAPGVADG